ncbi:hypothetical protein LTR28_012681, partial [Elasticomyces elasticus]
MASQDAKEEEDLAGNLETVRKDVVTRGEGPPRSVLRVILEAEEEEERGTILVATPSRPGRPAEQAAAPQGAATLDAVAGSSAETGVGQSGSTASGVRPQATPEEVVEARPFTFAVLWETVARLFVTYLLVIEHFFGTSLHAVQHFFANSLHAVQHFSDRFSNIIKKLLVASLVLLLAALCLTPTRQYVSTGLFRANDVAHNVAYNTKALIHSFTSNGTPYGERPVYDRKLYGRVSHLESSVQDIQKRLGHQHAYLQKLRGILPDNIVVRKSKTTGQLEVSELFYQAIGPKIEQMVDDLVGERKIRVEVPTWDHWLRVNEAKLDAIVNEHINERKIASLVQGNIDEMTDSLDVYITGALNRHHIISKEMFTSLLEERLDAMSMQVKNNIHTEIDESHRILSSNIGTIARREASNLVNSLPERSTYDGGSALLSLTASILLTNAEIALKTVNFFSAATGAVVDPYLTSPTQYKRQKKFLGRVYANMPWMPTPHPPVAALERWDEATDCWCASHATTPEDRRAKAQIGVLMPRTVYPTKLVVEHVPAMGTLDIAAAPRELELWIE